MATRVGIIGAGIAGLCTAKVFKAFGYDVALIEKSADIGGVWSASRRYPGLTTQNPRDTYAFSDFPMPSDYPEWPTGEQVQRYLEDYASHFDLHDHIELNTKVETADLNEAQTEWTLTGQHQGPNAQTTERTWKFDQLIVCNGIFCKPAVPNFAGRESFEKAGGRVYHTSEFTDLESARDKHVLVVGYGKSSCDVAQATVGTSASTTLVARNLIWKVPKKLGKRLNFKFLLLSRLGEALFRYIRLRGIERFLHGPGLPLRNAMLKSVENVIAKQYKLRSINLHPEKPLETIARSTVSLVTDGFYESIADQKLTMLKGTAIESLGPGTAQLSNGQEISADIVVCGTGWDQEVPFFNKAMHERVTNDEGDFRLYKSMLPVDVPRLGFNGYNSSFFSQLNAEIGALWLVEYVSGHLKLPPAEEMNSDIDERLVWMIERTDKKHCKGTNIIPFSVHQMDELLSDIDLSLGVFRRISQWVMPVRGSDYRPLTPRLLSRRRRSTN